MLTDSVQRCWKILRARTAAWQRPLWRVRFWLVLRHFENRTAGRQETVARALVRMSSGFCALPRRHGWREVRLGFTHGILVSCHLCKGEKQNRQEGEMAQKAGRREKSGEKKRSENYLPSCMLCNCQNSQWQTMTWWQKQAIIQLSAKS